MPQDHRSKRLGQSRLRRAKSLIHYKGPRRQPHDDKAPCRRGRRRRWTRRRRRWCGCVWRSTLPMQGVQATRTPTPVVLRSNTHVAAFPPLPCTHTHTTHAPTHILHRAAQRTRRPWEWTQCQQDKDVAGTTSSHQLLTSTSERATSSSSSSSSKRAVMMLPEIDDVSREGKEVTWEGARMDVSLVGCFEGAGVCGSPPSFRPVAVNIGLTTLEVEGD